MHPLVTARGKRLIGYSSCGSLRQRASRVNAKWPDGVVFCEAKHLQRQTRRPQCQVKAASRPEKPTVCIKSSAELWDCVSGSALFGQQRSDDHRYERYLGVRPSYQTPVGNIFNQATAARSKKRRHRKLCFIFTLHPTSFFKRLHDVHQEEALRQLAQLVGKKQKNLLFALHVITFPKVVWGHFIWHGILGLLVCFRGWYAVWFAAPHEKKQTLSLNPSSLKACLPGATVFSIDHVIRTKDAYAAWPDGIWLAVGAAEFKLNSNWIKSESFFVFAPSRAVFPPAFLVAVFM